MLLFLPSGWLRGLDSTFRALFSEAWQLAEREGFGSAQFLDIGGSQQLLFSSHLRERDKMLGVVK